MRALVEACYHKGTFLKETFRSWDDVYTDVD